MRETKDQTPFESDFKEADVPKGYRHIKQLQSDPDIIVRKEGLWNNKGTYICTAHYSKGKKLMEDLAETYDIPVVPMQSVVGRDENAGKDEDDVKYMYTVTQKIHGSNLRDVFTGKISNIDESQLQPQVEKLFLSQIAYVKDSFFNKEDFLSDVVDDFQYVYGHKKGEKKDRIYLVDIEPEYKADEDKEKEYKIVVSLKTILEQLNSVEKHLKIRLPAVRKTLLKASNKIIAKIDSPENKEELEKTINSLKLRQLNSVEKYLKIRLLAVRKALLEALNKIIVKTDSPEKKKKLENTINDQKEGEESAIHDN